MIRVGDMVVARRKERTQNYHNMIVGPVIIAEPYGCVIRTNDGTDICKEWTVFYKYWDVEVIADRLP